jgi:protein-tyrosine phosphatase
MAEGIFNKILERENTVNRFVVDSAGLLDYHQGNLPDSRMRLHASKRGYDLTHRSRQVIAVDFDRFDMIIGMDEDNIAGLGSIAKSSAHKAKIFRMTDFLQQKQASFVPDPYHGGDKGFELVIDLLEDTCEGLYRLIHEFD